MSTQVRISSSAFDVRPANVTIDMDESPQSVGGSSLAHDATSVTAAKATNVAHGARRLGRAPPGKPDAEGAWDRAVRTMGPINRT